MDAVRGIEPMQWFPPWVRPPERNSEPLKMPFEPCWSGYTSFEMPPLKVVLYNPRSVFYTMPLALLALGSYLDPKKYEVKVFDGRIDEEEAVLKECEDAICFGVTVLTGAPIHDALIMT